MAEKETLFAVRVADRDAFSSVLKDVAKAGMRIKRELPRIGVIEGFVDDDKIDVVKNVMGIESFAEAKKVGVV